MTNRANVVPVLGPDLSDATKSHATIRLAASQFLTLATSRQKLLRADEPRSGVRGLVDPKTGTLYVVEVSSLRLP